MKVIYGVRTFATVTDEALEGIATKMQIRSTMPTCAKGITLAWLDTDYFIPWDRLREPINVIQWMHHLAGKRGATKDHLLIFSAVVCDHWGWRTWI